MDFDLADDHTLLRRTVREFALAKVAPVAAELDRTKAFPYEIVHELGDVLAHVTLRMTDGVIESVITRRSAEEMKLKKGDSVTAVVKATEVMIAKP